MAEGIANRYSEDKGLGFICQEGGKEVLVERSSPEMPGYKTLNVGEPVSFQATQTIRGPQAKNVRRI